MNNAMTPEQFGKSYALLAAKESANDEDLFRVLSVLPDYPAYIDFRSKFKTGAIAAGYIETGFDKLWSRIIARLAETFSYSIPAKPITTKESAKVSESKKKASAEIEKLAELPEADIRARIDSLGKAIAESAAKGEVNKAATNEASRYFKALEKQKREASKEFDAEAKALRDELREVIKTASVDQLKSMLIAAKVQPVKGTESKRMKKAA